MCFTIGGDRTPTFAETAQQMHADHVSEIRERHARRQAEEEAERLRKQLIDAGLSPEQLRREGEQPSPLDSPRQQSWRR